VALGQEQEQDASGESGERGAGGHAVRGRDHLAPQHQAEAGDEKEHEGDDVDRLCEDECGGRLSQSHAVVPLEQPGLDGFAAERGQRGHRVESLADHPDFPERVEPVRDCPRGWNRSDEDCGLRERGREEQRAQRREARPADVVEPAPCLSEIGVSQGEPEQRRTGDQEQDGRVSHRRLSQVLPHLLKCADDVVHVAIVAQQ
jgi:hypothetical protein